MSNKKTIDIALDEIVSDSYSKYAKYIIQDRALPDVRDGLKPVQRRILYAMDELKIHFDKPYKKSARTVGEVIGKYHPHGDSSIYEAMVRMSQDWKNNLCLLDMHGNKGSIDGDNAAAMRYTETRLAKVANLMLELLQKQTVKFTPNFDDSEKEPSILPSIFPNLLINGATGIASGYATNIPPHNPNEVFDAMIYRIKHPNCDISKLIKLCPAPDFPTGGEIHGLDGCHNAHKTGVGKFFVRSSFIFKTNDNRIDQIIINSIPYETNKSEIIKQIDRIIYNKEVSGLLEVRDESDSSGVSIVIDVKKDNNLQNIINYLFKKTNLQISYNTNFVAIINRAPAILSLDMYLDATINHSLDVINKADLYDLNKVNLRIEIVEGLIKCIDIIDEIIKIIRSSYSKQEAKEKLVNKFLFTWNQAEAIVMMRLYRLTKTDINDLKIELANLQETQNTLTNRINSIDIRKEYLISKLIQYKKEFGYKRKTKLLEEVQKIEINENDMIEKQDFNVLITKDGYIKTVKKKSFESSNYNEIGLKPGDLLVYHQVLSSHSKINIITSNAKLLSITVHKLPNLRWKDVGEHLNTFFKCDANEKVIYAFVSEDDNYLENKQLIVASKNNLIKKINLQECELNKTTKQINIAKLNDNDELVFAKMVENDVKQLVFAITNKGNGLLFTSSQINTLARSSKGTKIAKLKNDEVIVDLILSDSNGVDLILFLDQGFKIISLKDFKLSKRALSPVSLYLQTKKTIYTKKVFLLSDINVFYLLKEDQNTTPISIDNYKTTPTASKPIKYEDNLKLIDASIDNYLSNQVVEDYKNATIVASKINDDILEEDSDD